jgi:hypothetical protein
MERGEPAGFGAERGPASAGRRVVTYTNSRTMPIRWARGSPASEPALGGGRKHRRENAEKALGACYCTSSGSVPTACPEASVVILSTRASA